MTTTNTIPKPRRRWYQFSLRTMFVLVFLVSIPLAWVGYSLNWIWQRRASLPKEYWPSYYKGTTTAPGGLWLFGEGGVQGLHLIGASDARIEETKRLFPEAHISTYEGRSDHDALGRQ